MARPGCTCEESSEIQADISCCVLGARRIKSNCGWAWLADLRLGGYLAVRFGGRNAEMVSRDRVTRAHLSADFGAIVNVTAVALFWLSDTGLNGVAGDCHRDSRINIVALSNLRRTRKPSRHVGS